MKQAVIISSLLMGGVLLSACQSASDNKPEQNNTASATVASIQSPHHVASVAVASTVSPQAIQNGAAQKGAPKHINWALVDSGIKPVDKASFKYPFALDSEPVKAYAEMYHVDNETSRYNLTVGMAVNEVLSKVLDQLGTAYVSHELTAGKNSAFVIHTTQQIAPSQYTYVFAEPFAKGLTIPVKIINDGKK
ncbi:hypothetical protein A9299_00660 [Moraxella osloensis]|uniref:Lipoprotein n=1 Tax=Faucicola osloensis TaxID=34062 RepID=A0AA91FIK7_FAUOS|nr:hypothetical protein [Moraxella osloensis]OBX63555.1 hypothetical protein A9299_00660 [Moraxella osloensis]